MKEELKAYILANFEKEHEPKMGFFAKCRRLTPEEIAEKVKNGEPYIIRFKSPGSFDNKIKVHDLIKGDVEFPENDIDDVILKSDGLPTYHFAHVIDDHLMHTTHVIRGDEWLPSLPKHIQMFRLMGFEHFKIVVNDIRMYRQAGNSIAVPVLNALVKQLLPFLDVENEIEICEQTDVSK